MNDPGLSREIEQARQVAESVRDNPALYMKALGLIAVLVYKEDQHRILAGHFLTKRQMLEIGNALVEAMIVEFRDTPNFEEKFDRITAKLTGVVEGQQNTKQELRRLERREQT
jgi:hypothetical protein